MTTLATALAAVVTGHGRPPQLLEQPAPVAGPGETLVRVLAAPVSHLDVDVVAGDFALGAPPPFVPGIEAAGTVVTSATHTVDSLVRVRGGGVGLSRPGTWAELVAAPDAAVRAVPAGVPPDLACSSFSPACSAWAAVHDLAVVRGGERVLVTGAAGAVGALAVQLASRAGAQVVGSTRRDLQDVPAEADPVLADDLDGVEPVDVLVDTVGGPQLPRALARVRPGGRAVLVGYTAGRRLELDLQAFMHADVSVHPLNMLRRAPGLLDVGDRLARDLAEGRLTLALQHLPLAQAAEAVELVKAGRVRGRAVLVVEQPS